MNVLVLVEKLPFPINTGGKYHAYKILQLLSKRYSVDLLSFNENNQKISSSLKKLCHSIKIFSLQNLRWTLLEKIIYSFIGSNPFYMQKYYSADVGKYIQNTCLEKKYDMVFIFGLVLTQYIQYFPKCKLINIQQNILSDSFFSYMQTTNILSKINHYIQAWKFRIWERSILSIFDYILSVSKQDKFRLLQILWPYKSIYILPMPINTKKLFSVHNKPRIFFVGSLHWKPNIHGLLWFIKKVYPLIKVRIPRVEFYIVGKNSEIVKSILNYPYDQSIKFLGYKKQIVPLYKQMCVSIVPIKIANSGIRIKLIESLAYGIPTVSTTYGAVGIAVRNKREILFADTPEDFANAVIKVLKDKDLAKRISGNAIKFIKKYYNKEEAEKALNLLDKLCISK